MVPVVLLGSLVIAAPDTFAVPSTASETLAEPAGETLQIYVLPLRPGNVDLHLYLVGSGAARPSFKSIAMQAISATGAHAKVSFYEAGTGHDIAEVPLPTRGVWDFRVSGTDGAGHRLGGSFAVPIN